MKHSQKSHSSAGYHNMIVVLFTLLSVLICGSLALSPKAQTKTSDEQQRALTPKTVPGRNGKIAFTSTRDGNHEIYTMEADGSNQTRLTNNPEYDKLPKWSPDGTKIAFVSSRDGNNYKIYVMNADGSNQTRLTNNLSGEPPDWSPDGTRILFDAVVGNTREIFVVNADGTNQTQLTNSGGFSPIWSPDGTRIMFYRISGTVGIYVMNADGSNQTQLLNSGHDYSPRWSPDGTKIAFESNRDDPSRNTCNSNCNVEIYSMNADGSNQTRLTNNPRLDYSPEWSPDGTRIVFRSLRDNNINLYVMNADGTSQTRLTNYTEDYDVFSPIFSPDGTRIMFSYGYSFAGELIASEIYVMNADGSNPVRLTNTNAYEAELDWQALSLTSPSCPNPIDCAEFFVRQQYRDFLNREPDTPGLTFWTGEITECSNPEKRQPGESFIACTERKRANTSAAFFLSPEFQNTGSFVVRVYWGTLGKLPNTPESACPSLPDGYSGQCRPLYSEYIADVSQVANGIVVNDQLDPNVINANKRAFVDQFVNTVAFKAKYDSLSNQQFVDTLFQTTGINASASDRAALVNGLNAQPATETRSSVVFKVVDGTTTQAGGALQFNTTYGKAFYDKEFDDAFVFMEYIGYLRRNPDQGGFEFWLSKLKFYGNWQDAQMVLAFISSPEYRARFGQP